MEDLDVLDGMQATMGLTPGTTICGLADGAAWPFKNVLAKFRGECEDYIRTHQTRKDAVTPLQRSIFAGLAADPTGNASLPILPGPAPAGALRSPHAN